jgi:hypothetical protein
MREPRIFGVIIFGVILRVIFQVIFHIATRQQPAMIVAQGPNQYFQRLVVQFQSFVQLSLIFKNNSHVHLSAGHVHS